MTGLKGLGIRRLIVRVPERGETSSILLGLRQGGVKEPGRVQSTEMLLHPRWEECELCKRGIVNGRNSLGVCGIHLRYSSDTAG